MLTDPYLPDIRTLRSPELSRLLLAFIVSLILHLAVYGTYKTGHALGLWERLHWKPMSEIIEELHEARMDPLQATGEPPLLFVDVNPAAATSDAPEDARFYSDKNSRAANPLTDETTEVPMFDGSQQKMVRTDDVPPSKATPLQPAAAPPAPEPELEPDKPVEEPSAPPKGDLLLAKAMEQEEPKDTARPETPPRPRTLKEAMSRLPQSEIERLAGRKMRQDGGVRRLSMLSTLDVRASPFGEYDSAVILAIQSRWFDLLDRRGFGYEKSGRVVLEFRLHYDGRVSRMNVAENTVDEMLSLLCQKAVMDPAPYGKWPSDMRRMIGSNYRDVRFTFYYN
jgi:outer membrane biosynthesis protein TonB